MALAAFDALGRQGWARDLLGAQATRFAWEEARPGNWQHNLWRLGLMDCAGLIEVPEAAPSLSQRWTH